MAFKAKIQEVNLEKVVKGRNSYEVAHVNYVYNGSAKTQKIMSFANPQVFKAVQALAGKNVEITTVEANGYTNWSQVVEVGDSAPSVTTGAPGTTTGGRTSVSTYETPEERKIKQLYIVKQSSITNAIATLQVSGNKTPLNPHEVITVAQIYVDFVYGNNIRDLLEMDSDDPEISVE